MSNTHLFPHCNGTHTECIGHITHERISVRNCLEDVFIDATLISLQPTSASETEETYHSESDKGDHLITRELIEDLRSEIREGSALVVRTLPNEASKLTKKYGDYITAILLKRSNRSYCRAGSKTFVG